MDEHVSIHQVMLSIHQAIAWMNMSPSTRLCSHPRRHHANRAWTCSPSSCPCTGLVRVTFSSSSSPLSCIVAVNLSMHRPLRPSTHTWPASLSPPSAPSAAPVRRACIFYTVSSVRRACPPRPRTLRFLVAAAALRCDEGQSHSLRFLCAIPTVSSRATLCCSLAV